MLCADCRIFRTGKSSIHAGFCDLRGCRKGHSGPLPYYTPDRGLLARDRHQLAVLHVEPERLVAAEVAVALPPLVVLHLGDALAGAVALGLGHCAQDREH